jgi:hypothetical protein
VVFSVLFQVAMLTRFRDSGDDFRATYGFQKIQLFAQFFGTT